MCDGSGSASAASNSAASGQGGSVGSASPVLPLFGQQALAQDFSSLVNSRTLGQPLSAVEKDAVNALANVADVDNNGKVTRDELANAVEKYGAQAGLNTNDPQFQEFVSSIRNSEAIPEDGWRPDQVVQFAEELAKEANGAEEVLILAGAASQSGAVNLLSAPPSSAVSLNSKSVTSLVNPLTSFIGVR